VIVYGVDPGLTGALSVFINGELREVRDMPVRDTGSTGKTKRKVCAAGLAALVRDWRARFGPDAEMAVIESVAAMPGQGVSSMFSLGHSCGAIEAAFLALGVSVQFVTPGAWKRAAGLSADKGHARGMASLRWPSMAGEWQRVKDHGRAEAALIGAYGHKAFA
jgi:crossover junction endodeoxyribonuclease RuvC